MISLPAHVFCNWGNTTCCRHPEALGFQTLEGNHKVIPAHLCSPRCLGSLILPPFSHAQGKISLIRTERRRFCRDFVTKLSPTKYLSCHGCNHLNRNFHFAIGQSFEEVTQKCNLLHREGGNLRNVCRHRKSMTPCNLLGS